MRNVGNRLERRGRVGGNVGTLEPELLRKPGKLEFLADCRELFRVNAVEPVSFPVRLNRNVGANRREELRHRRVFAARENPLGQLALQLRLICEYAVQVAVFLQERGCRLLPHSAYAGDVVGRITCKRKVVDHARWLLQPPVAAYSSLVVDFRGVSGTARAIELHPGPHELRGILVGRCKIYVKSCGGAFDGESPHYVVGLEAVNAENGDLQRLRKLKGVWYRSGEVFRHLLALRLVVWIRLVAERRPARIHRENRVSRLLLLEYGKKPVGKANQRRGVYSRRRHARIAQKHEMPPVEERHHVDYEYLVHPVTS